MSKLNYNKKRFNNRKINLIVKLITMFCKIQSKKIQKLLMNYKISFLTSNPRLKNYLPNTNQKCNNRLQKIGVNNFSAYRKYKIRKGKLKLLIYR